jgi:integrase
MLQQLTGPQSEVMRTSAEIIDIHLTHLHAAGLAATTIETARFVLNKINGELSHGLACATGEELAGWLANDRWVVKTKATYHLHITRFFRWAAGGRDPWISYDPSAELARPKPPRGRPHPPTDDVARRCVTDAVPPHLLVCRLAAYAGLRVHEAGKAQRRDITHERIRVVGKGGRERLIPTHSRIWELVEPMPPGLLVARPDGARYTARDLSSAVNYHLAHRVGVADTTIHDLRHWFATKQIDAGTNLRTVQELMGHSSPATTAIYTLVSDDLMRAAVAGLPTFSG